MLLSCLGGKQCYDLAQGRTGMILLLFCCIDFSAVKHYTESSSGDNLRPVPKPSSLRCGWLTVCHSTAPCGVISTLSPDLCLTSGRSMYALRHINVSSSTLMLSDGWRSWVLFIIPKPTQFALNGRWLMVESSAEKQSALMWTSATTPTGPASEVTDFNPKHQAQWMSSSQLLFCVVILAFEQQPDSLVL